MSMQKSKSLLFGFHDEDLETYIQQQLQAQGFSVVSAVKYSMDAIERYVSLNPVDTIIMRCNTISELKQAGNLRDLNSTLILLVTGAMKGTPEIEDALSEGLNNIVFAGLRSSKNLRSEIVDIVREERTRKQARVYYGFEPLKRPECFNGEFSIRNETQLLQLYEFLLDKSDDRELSVRFEKVLNMLPASERKEMALTLPAPIKGLIQDSTPYIALMTQEKKKKAGFFRKRKKEEESEQETGLALTGSSHFLNTVSMMVSQYHKHQFGDWEVIRPATNEEEGEECRCCACGYKETRAIPSAAEKNKAEESAKVVEERVEPTCEKEGHIIQKNPDGSTEVLCDLPALGHSLVEQVQKPADCVNEGVAIKVCTRCRKIISSSPILPNGKHWWSEWRVEKEATCKENGMQVRVCSRCGEKERATIPTNGNHKYSEWEIIKESTCLENGSRIRHCLLCDEKEQEIIPALGHDFQKKIGRKATCGEPGYYNAECTRCGEKKENVEEIPALTAHKYSEWETNKEATCLEEGLRQRRCIICGKEDTEILPAFGHDYEKVIGKAATCKTPGYYDRKCRRCGEVESHIEMIPVSQEHTIRKRLIRMATCEEPGICQSRCIVCGKQTTDTIPPTHKPRGRWTVIKAATCTEDGERSNTCAICGKAYHESIPSAGHNYGDWKEIQKGSCSTPLIRERVCSVCGNAERKETPFLHQFTKIVLQKGTCTEPEITQEKCKLCGFECETQRIDPPGHIYGAPICKEPDCVHSGEVFMNCKICGSKKLQAQLEPLGHIPKKEVVNKETCEAEGIYKTVCTRCQSVLDTQIIPATGHNFTEWQIVRTPDCRQAGEEKHICKSCGYEETREIPMTPHIWGEEETIPSTCIENGYTRRVCVNCGEETVTDTLPYANHQYGKWKASGFKDVHTCSVCGEKETRISAKRIIAASVCGVVAIGATGTGIVLTRKQQKANPGYLAEVSTETSAEETTIGSVEQTLLVEPSSTETEIKATISEAEVIIDLFYSQIDQINDMLSSLLDKWEPNKQLLSRDFGILGKNESFVCSSDLFTGVSDKINRILLQWTNENAQDTEEQASLQETEEMQVPEAESTDEDWVRGTE